MNIYVRNLSPETLRSELLGCFEIFGKVADITISTYRVEDRSCASGFVEMPSREQAQAAIDNLHCHPIDKTGSARDFDTRTWRLKLEQAAIQSLENHQTEPYTPVGPFDATVWWRDGKAVATQLARRWNLAAENNRIHLHAGDIHELYLQLIRMCYLTPAVEKIFKPAMAAFNCWGRSGIWRARRRLRRWGAFR